MARIRGTKTKKTGSFNFGGKKGQTAFKKAPKKEKVSQHKKDQKTTASIDKFRSYSRISLSRTFKGPKYLFELEKVRDRESKLA